jgi:ferric-dicitrate binding protein FerR (iron transport regulator)
MRRLTAAAVVFSICPGLVAGPVLAAGGDPIGATLSVVDIVTAAYNRDTRTLAAGDGVRQNELIDVSKDGSTELKLNDETKLALGPGAKLMLDKFVYDPDKATGDIGVDLVEGAFRFMTGVAKKPSYVVKVPRASITVRGTIFDVYVQPDDTSWLLLHEGAVTVCDERGRCRDLDEPGKLIQITSAGDVRPPANWAKIDKAVLPPLDSAFPFVKKPPAIDPNPVFTPETLIKLGALDPDVRPPRRVKDDPPPRRTKKPKTEKAEDKPAKKKPVKVASPPKQKPSKTRRASNDDAAAKAALGLAIGVGIGIGVGKIGGGGGRRGGDYGGGGRMPSPKMQTPR